MHRRTTQRLIILLAAAWIGMAAEATAAEPSFPAVDGEPLGTVSEDALVLHSGWQMRESAIAGNDGAAFSRTGFDAAGWYATSVPTTALGTLVRHGVYPDPYVGMNNMRIPDASDDHNRRYDLARSPATAICRSRPTPGPSPIGSARSSGCRRDTAARSCGCTSTGSIIGPTSG
jgi:hypothetical protein